MWNRYVEAESEYIRYREHRWPDGTMFFLSSRVLRALASLGLYSRCSLMLYVGRVQISRDNPDRRINIHSFLWSLSSLISKFSDCADSHSSRYVPLISYQSSAIASELRRDGFSENGPASALDPICPVAFLSVQELPERNMILICAQPKSFRSDAKAAYTSFPIMFMPLASLVLALKRS